MKKLQIATTANDAKGTGAPADARPQNGQSAVTDAEPALIVFGLDDSGKAHASWFGAADAELAERAAGLMRFKALRVTSPDVRAKALELAAGRVFASGKGFVPFCKMAAHEALNGCEGVFEPPVPVEPEPAPLPADVITPTSWKDIAVGALVLASAGEDESWWAAVVVEDRGEHLFVLRWRDWLDEAPFVRRLDGLALLPPRVAAA